jgi:hypothetical protein
VKCHIGRVASLYLQGETFGTKLVTHSKKLIVENSLDYKEVLLGQSLRDNTFYNHLTGKKLEV